MVHYTATLNTATVVTTYAEAKDHLRLTHDYQQTLVQSYIDAAVVFAENYTGRAIHVYDVVATTSKFCDAYQLENTPLKGTVTIQYYDSDNAIQTLSSSLYSIQYNNGEPVIYYSDVTSWPDVYDREDAVKISYQTGYDAANVPEPFKIYILLLVSFLYDNPSDTIDKLPRFIHSAIRSYKKW